MDGKHESVYVPEGISFGDKVLRFPSVSMAFSHSGRIRSTYSNTYRWIDRGSAIGHYMIEVDKVDIPILRVFIGTRTEEAAIPSPVSGLLIHASYDFSSGAGLTAVLLPDDEPAAENGKYMFEAVCSLCERHRPYFMKASRYWSMEGWSSSRFDREVENQLSQECQYEDAMPRYSDYFDEIRSRHPDLRPFIRHLA